MTASNSMRVIRKSLRMSRFCYLIVADRGCGDPILRSNGEPKTIGKLPSFGVVVVESGST
jgi:hypothetical protein